MKTRQQRNREKDQIARLRKEERKLFFANLKKICNLIAGYDLYSKIPSDKLELIYTRRLRRVTLSNELDQYTIKEVRQFGEYIVAIISTMDVELPDGKGLAPLAIYLIEGLTLIFVVKIFKDEDFPAARECREVLGKTSTTDHMFKVFEKLHWVNFTFGAMQSRFDTGFISCKHHIEPEKEKEKNTVRCMVDICKTNPVMVHFTIDGQTRPAYRVGWMFPDHDMRWAEIKSSSLQPGHQKDMTMPVFIQSHALLRMKERIGIDTGLIYYSLYESLLTVSQHQLDNGKILIDYLYQRKKIGYLVCSIQADKVLIHTFLFITHQGTPEGKKLYELTGIQKADNKFLAIDKLTTFLSYDLENNELVKNIFIEAGCAQLLEMYENKHHLLKPPTTAISADIIAKYLQVNFTKEDIMESLKNSDFRMVEK
ncbi:hypothetical protein WSM22_26520 [Cytophagales bacterium WSM2-2]|nr:hypothetical protein WSM22_26520 [Cytophagales bacterium WSM2-2]